MAALLLAAILGAAALAFILLPLLRRAKPEEAERPASPLDQLRHEKEGIYLAIREVEFDHRTGKVSDADHAALVARYRARAIELLKRIDILESAAEAERAVPAPAGNEGSRDRVDDEIRATLTGDPRTAAPLPRCTGCGAPMLPVHRFCTRCGAPAPGESAATKEGA